MPSPRLTLPKSREPIRASSMPDLKSAVGYNPHARFGLQPPALRGSKEGPFDGRGLVEARKADLQESAQVVPVAASRLLRGCR